MLNLVVRDDREGFMGREIEIKIPLTDVEYKRIFDFVNGNTDFDGVSICGSKAEHLLKSDEYYSR